MTQTSMTSHANSARSHRSALVRTLLTAMLVGGLSFGAMAPAAADTGASVRTGPSSVICGYFPYLCRGGH
ncbi:hypothetical protein [Kocuria varians]|nr:hypothetical protein [Kocuria varians]